MNATVISAAFWYDPERLRLFLCSAKEHLPFARVILLCERHDRNLARAVRAFNPEAEVYVPKDSLPRRVLWRLTQQSAGFCAGVARLQSTLGLRTPRWFHALFLHVALARYFYALILLEENSSEYVLLCDSRDVVFQRNPFKGADGRLVTGEEAIKIMDCPINSRWIRKVYGKSMVERLGRHRVLCSGVTYGPWETARKYLEAMVTETARLAPALYFQDGYDQAIHNKLLRIDTPTPLRISACGTRHVATLHYSKIREFRIDPEAGLLTTEGEPVAIVHQYDRHPKLKTWFAQRYE